MHIKQKKTIGLLAAALFFAQAPGTSCAEEQALRIAVSALPPFLGHPYASTARPTIFTSSAYYDGLIKFDVQGNIKPWLAMAWENVDQFTWRFTLRDDVIFSNGRPLTTQSIVTAVNWLVSDESVRDGVRGEISFLKEVRVIDDWTAEIITNIPVPLMPRYMGSLVMAEPVAFAALGRQGYAEDPIGTGPFKVDQWRPNRITLSAFRQSWRAPKVDRLEIIALPSISGRVQALLSGQIDIALNLGPDERTSIENGGAKLNAWLDPSVTAVSFITTKDGPLQNVKVRQALNYAVNKKAIIDNLFEGMPIPATQGVSHQAYGFEPNLKPYLYDPEKAQQLLSEAGFEDGFKFQMITQTGLASGVLLFQQVAADLARIGVTMEIRQMPSAAYLEAVLRDPDHGGADAHTTVWPAWPIFDALRPLLMHSCRRQPPWHCDDNIQPKIEAALVEWDDKKGLQMRYELMAYYRETAPAIFLFESPEYVGLSQRVSGFRQMHGNIAYHEINLGE
ncbi:MAG: ABC transporter substrate-binding protein [Rhodospirillaceae bacterium]